MADEKIDYFEGIRDHFNAQETKVIEVPEWGLVGDKAIHCKPFNMQEKAKIFKGATTTDLIVLIDVIVEPPLIPPAPLSKLTNIPKVKLDKSLTFVISI